jgi:hypothetical protein
MCELMKVSELSALTVEDILRWKHADEPADDIRDRDWLLLRLLSFPLPRVLAHQTRAFAITLPAGRRAAVARAPGGGLPSLSLAFPFPRRRAPSTLAVVVAAAIAVR